MLLNIDAKKLFDTKKIIIIRNCSKIIFEIGDF